MKIEDTPEMKDDACRKVRIAVCDGVAHAIREGVVRADVIVTGMIQAAVAGIASMPGSYLDNVQWALGNFLLACKDLGPDSVEFGFEMERKESAADASEH
jgi:hypothetical protein